MTVNYLAHSANDTEVARNERSIKAFPYKDKERPDKTWLST